MRMMNERKKIIEYGKKLLQDNYTLGTGGNLSIFNREEQLMLITPSGIPFQDIQESDLVLMTLDGTVVDGAKKPSSEWFMHKIFYEKRTDLNSLIHAHTIYSTVLAELRQGLPATHYMIAVAGPDVRCATYASYGTKELAENAYNAMVDRKAVLLANHGVLVGHKNIENAYNVLEEVEYCANIYYRAKSIGNPIILEDEEMEKMAEKFETYGQV